MSWDSWPILSTECVNDWHPECRIDGCICDCHAATVPAVPVAPIPLPKATSSRERVYAELIAYQQRHGFPPTVRELGELVGLTSPSSVHYHLKMLGESGRISHRRGQPRTAIPTSTGAQA